MNCKPLAKYILPLFLFLSINASSQKEAVNVNYNEALRMMNPLVHTNNPVRLQFSKMDSTGNFLLRYYNENGDFKPIMTGNKFNAFSLETERYIQIGKTHWYGSFEYNKSLEDNMQYTNVYNSYRGTPYLYADTIGGDEFDREEFKVVAAFSREMFEAFLFGTQIDYNVGLGAQNRDPRALNKMLDLAIRPGIMVEIGTLKLGVDVFYNLYNEEIEIGIVEDNATHTIYSLKGLGTYSKHNSITFTRLYKRNTYGGNVQLHSQHNLLNIGISAFYEDVIDGRKNSSASWASGGKQDANYRGIQYEIMNVSTLRQGEKYHHQVVADVEFEKSVGGEILQELQKTNDDYNIYVWKTLLEEDKYAKDRLNAMLSYEFAKYKSKMLRDYSLKLSANYLDEEENHYFHEQKLQISNLLLGISANKLLIINKKNSIDIGITASYKTNLNSTLEIPYQSIITKKIIIPDYQYFISDYLGFGMKACYDYRLKSGHRIFANMKYHLIDTDSDDMNGTKRTFFDISLGILLK